MQAVVARRPGGLVHFPVRVGPLALAMTDRATSGKRAARPRTPGEKSQRTFVLFVPLQPDGIARRSAYPKERAKASGAWPSMRSWTNAAICIAAMEAIDAEPLLRYRAVAGCVGEEAALEFQTWEQSLDLPDPEAWLSQAKAARRGGRPPLCWTFRRVAIKSWRRWPRWWTG